MYYAYDENSDIIIIAGPCKDLYELSMELSKYISEYECELRDIEILVKVPDITISQQVIITEG